ncbi:type IV pilin biogenesis protein, partial [Serratia fonticola]|nr:type IV pilin biogenesis protein [Serratia fonticola]
DKLAVWHEQQTYELADTLAQTLEPLLMIVVGGIVGTLVIAMYLPIFQLGNVLG